MVLRGSRSESGSQVEKDSAPRQANTSKENTEPTFIPSDSLTCPILAKISVAFEFAAKASSAEKDGDLYPGSKAIKGLHETSVHLAWKEMDMVLIVAFRSPSHDVAAEMMSAVYEKRRMPNFLSKTAPDAEVHSGFLDLLDSFQRRDDGTEVLADTVREITGGRTPRRILMTGFCLGGSLATIAACWAALQSPTSDVRCITFGSPNVGNAAFVDAFRWVVGTSYRVSFGKDPMASSGGGLLGGFEHVPGTIYLDEEANLEHSNPWLTPWTREMKDHCIQRYADALRRQATKTKKTEQRRCAEAPCSTYMCTLKTGPEPSQGSTSSRPASRRNSATGRGNAAARAASERQSAALLQEAARRVPAAPANGVPSPTATAPASAEKTSTAASGAPVAAPASGVPSAAPAAENSPAAANGGAPAKSGNHHPSGKAGYVFPQQLTGLDKACTLCPEAGIRPAPAENGKAREGESQEERQARHESAAAGLFRSVVQEATGNQDIGVAEPPRWLTRAFSLLEREDLSVDLKHLHTLQKVLTIGKISSAVVLAGAAYQDEAGYARMTGIPIDKTRMIDDKGGTDIQVHVSWIDKGTAVFAFRGTESTKDGLQDMKFVRRNIDYLQRAYPGAKAHTGFLQQFAAVVDESRPEMHLAKVLAELSGGRMPNRVLCTGHSLGGALATLGAAWAAIEYPYADVRCITFGSPRVANRKFKRAFHALVGTSLRLTYGADPVPSFPPNFRYDHVGSSIHVRQEGLMLSARPWHFAWRLNVGDHFLNKYTAGVYSILPGGMQALPKFDESDFKIPAEATASGISCFGVTRTLETESDDSESDDSPRHPDAANSGREKHNKSDGGHGGLFQRLMHHQKSRGAKTAAGVSNGSISVAEAAANGDKQQPELVDIPEGGQELSGAPPDLAATGTPQAAAEDGPNRQEDNKRHPGKEPLLARISRSLHLRRSSGLNGALSADNITHPQAEPIAAH